MPSLNYKSCFNHLLPGTWVNGYKDEQKSGGGLIP